jgi:hypothetical protein
MGGKAAMLLVLGFSIIFLVFGNNFNNLSTRSVENNADYYIHNMSHNIAIAGANLAANRVFIDKTWDVGYEDLAYQDGIINVYITNPTGGGGGKVEVCHGKGLHHAHTISIGAPAVPAHLAHGDTFGPCGGATPPEMVVIYSEGIYMGDTSTVYVELQPSTFAKYGNFYDKMSAIPATGDIFDGPFHVNDKMKTWGSPEFFGKVTSKKGLTLMGTKDPVFHGGYESGVDVERPFDTTGMRTAGSAGGLVIKDTTGSGDKIDVEIEFKNANVEYRFKIDDGANKWSTKETVKLKDFNGMMYVEKGNVFVKGQLDGAATVVATKKGLAGCGNIYQTDDIKYKDDVKKKPNSDNMLGLVAEENIRLQYNNDTKGKDIISQASMFAYNGDVGPDNALITNDHKLAEWQILGGVISHDVRVTAHYNSVGPYEGYKFVHTYDDRFLHSVPPFFPHTKNYEVVSWYE